MLENASRDAWPLKGYNPLVELVVRCGSAALTGLEKHEQRIANL
jgi:hypothetical protein